jgi:hypothetical protein
MYRKNPKIFVFFACLLVLFSSWRCYENRSVQVIVQTPGGAHFSIEMSREDRERLTFLFYRMMILDAGAYTLLGNKPIYMGGYIKPFSTSNDWRNFLASIFFDNIKRAWGWDTWQKYSHHFQSSPFLLKAEINPFWTEPHEAVSILVINKKRLENTFLSCRKDFELVLQKNNITYRALLAEAEAKPFLKTVLQRHEGLIGTVFGYGRDNAWLFEEKCRGHQVALKPLWGEEIYDFFANRPDGVHLDDLSLVLGYPCFLADPNSPETKELKKEFLEVREKILEYYQDKDFLEATLSLLAGHSPTPNGVALYQLAKSL